VRDWMKERSMFGIWKTLLEEQRLEDNESYRNYLRECEEQFSCLHFSLRNRILSWEISSHRRFVFNSATHVSCTQDNNLQIYSWSAGCHFRVTEGVGLKCVTVL
jgi:hypothetical protein